MWYTICTEANARLLLLLLLLLLRLLCRLRWRLGDRDRELERERDRDELRDDELDELDDEYRLYLPSRFSRLVLRLRLRRWLRFLLRLRRRRWASLLLLADAPATGFFPPFLISAYLMPVVFENNPHTVIHQRSCLRVCVRACRKEQT